MNWKRTTDKTIVPCWNWKMMRIYLSPLTTTNPLLYEILIATYFLTDSLQQLIENVMKKCTRTQDDINFPPWSGYWFRLTFYCSLDHVYPLENHLSKFKSILLHWHKPIKLSKWHHSMRFTCFIKNWTWLIRFKKTPLWMKEKLYLIFNEFLIEQWIIRLIILIWYLKY